MPILTLCSKSMPSTDSRKPCTKCCRDCSPSPTVSMPASSCALTDSSVASRFASASSSPASFHCGHNLFCSASQAGLGRLPAIAVSNMAMWGPVVEGRYIISRHGRGRKSGQFCAPSPDRRESSRRLRVPPGASRSNRREPDMMKVLLKIARAIDSLNERIGRAVIWLVLAMALISTANALARYLFNRSSNAWLELQWYLFAAVFLLCAGYTLLHNEHIRIDVLSSRLSARSRLWIDILGTVLFLLPVSFFIVWLSWPVFMNAWVSNEMSSNAGGLLRWPARWLVPAGFLLLSLQGLSELIKRVAALRGLITDPMARPPVPLAIPTQDDSR